MATLQAAAAEPTREQIDFFERKIRPVLVEHCYRCHSTKARRLKAKLLLDTREGIRKGGESGPAVVPGNVRKSLLIRALRFENDLEMPPKGKLPKAVVDDFVKWVAMGAPDPRRDKATTATDDAIDFKEARKHWAYQPIRRPAVPKVQDADSAIDAFVLARLNKSGLNVSEPADRRTLIRRAYFDLIGMPPTFSEVDEFVSDRRPDAFARVLDRLLASPHYGERWGRHWLDVARYADTKDIVLVFGKDRIRPYAYTYRDYVVRAFNEDVPYDRFIHEQIAVDQLSAPVEKWKLGAMGFLTLGRLYANSLPDIYDDQIDTITRGLLGLTVSCARCHDHKYDAIPTADYYSLYGIFASCEKPVRRPLVERPRRTPEYLAFNKKLEAKHAELQRHIDRQYKQITEQARSQVTEYLLEFATDKPGPLPEASFFQSLSPNDLRPRIQSRWRRYLEKHAQPSDPVFGPWNDFMQVDDLSDPSQARQVVTRWVEKPEGTTAGKINPLLRSALQTTTPTSKADVARLYGDLLKSVYAQSKGGKSDQPERQQLLDILVSPDGPVYFPRRETSHNMSRVPKGQYRRFLLEIDKLAIYSPHAPGRAMVLTDSREPFQPRVFVRGNPRRPGPAVPRQFPRILTDGRSKPFTEGSGRLELAHAITAAENPLTARVIVNRVWMHHFGQPLVQTPSDFGVRSEPPSHPELLDYVAWTLQEDGWSLKKLHRRIMLSRVYQQASKDRPECRKLDPDNKFLWRFRRHRLGLEAMRDSLLAVTGRLDRRVGGRAVDIVGDPNNRRRTIYGLVDRQDLPSLFRVFDFPNPDQTTAQRPRTTVPQQALFGLNSPFVLAQAKTLVARPEVSSAKTAKGRITALYRLVYQRKPTRTEMQQAMKFLQPGRADGRTRLNVWEQYAQVLLLTNEFMFVD